MQRKTTQSIFFIAIAFALIIGGYFYWLHQKMYPSTDDAYIQAHTVSIAAQVSGQIQNVYVKNQEDVTKNQLLFTINAKPFEIALEQAQANLKNTMEEIVAEKNAVKAAAAALEQSKAQLVDAQKSYDRIMALVKQGYYAKSFGDTVTRQLAVTKQAVIASRDNLNEARAKLGKSGNGNAQIEAAKAKLAQAKLNLQYTKVVAPHNGQLAELTLQSGQTVTAYESLFSLVENNKWWAMANLKETSLNRIRVGQKAIVHVDMYPSHPFHGVVKSISPGSGSSFSLLPAENATGNWVKVTQRFPTRVEITNPNKQFPLRIGASCTVVIDTK